MRCPQNPAGRYMVASWGGYSFVINIIPIHTLACIFTGRLSWRLYVAFAPFIVMGTLEAGGSAAGRLSVPLPARRTRYIWHADRERTWSRLEGFLSRPALCL